MPFKIKFFFKQFTQNVGVSADRMLHVEMFRLVFLISWCKISRKKIHLVLFSIEPKVTAD